MSEYDALLAPPKQPSPYDALLTPAPSPYDALLPKSEAITPRPVGQPEENVSAGEYPYPPLQESASQEIPPERRDLSTGTVRFLNELEFAQIQHEPLDGDKKDVSGIDVNSTNSASSEIPFTAEPYSESAKPSVNILPPPSKEFVKNNPNIGGAYSAVSELTNSLTSPDNIELMMATGGSGKIVQKLVGAGFAYLTAKNVADDVHKLQGVTDPAERAKLITSSILNAGVSTLIIRGELGESGTLTPDGRAAIKQADPAVLERAIQDVNFPKDWKTTIQQEIATRKKASLVNTAESIQNVASLTAQVLRQTEPSTPEIPAQGGETTNEVQGNKNRNGKEQAGPGEQSAIQADLQNPETRQPQPDQGEPGQPNEVLGETKESEVIQNENEIQSKNEGKEENANEEKEVATEGGSTPPSTNEPLVHKVDPPPELKPVLDTLKARYDGVQEGYKDIPSTHQITLPDTGDTINVPIDATPEEITKKVESKRAQDTSIQPAKVTGIKNALVDTERENKNLPEREKVAKRTFGTLLDEARDATSKDRKAGENLVESLKKNNRPLTDSEDALLTVEQVTRQNEYDKAVDDVNNAKTDPERAEAEARLSRARDSVYEIYDVGTKAGTASGRGLNARRLLVNQDYTLARMEARKRAANGGEPLTKAQSDDVRALHDKITEQEKRISDMESSQKDTIAKQYFDRLIKETRKQASESKKSGGNLTDFLQEQSNRARQRIKSRGITLNAGLNPAQLIDHAIIGADLIAKGTVKFAEWSGGMIKEFGEKIKPYLADLFERSKSYHEASVKLFADNADAKTRDQILEKAKTEKELNHQTVFDLARSHVNAGVHGFENVMKAVFGDLEPLHKGLKERDVRDAFSGYGEVRYPSKEADLTTLREYRRLGQLASAIEDANKGESPKKSGTQRDKPTQTIREKMAELQDAMEKNGIETKSPEEQLASRNQARETALRNQIEDLDKQLKTGEKPTKGTSVADNAEVETLKSQRDAMKAQLKEIEDAANPQKTAAEKQVDQLSKAKQKLDEILSGNRTKNPGKPFEALSDAAADIKSEIQAMQELAAQMERKSSLKDPNSIKERAQIKSLRESIDRYEKKSRDLDFNEKEKGASRPDTERISNLRDVLQLRKSVYDQLEKSSNPVLSPEELALNRYKKMIQKRTAELNSKLATGDYTKTQKSKTILDPEALKLKADYERSKLQFERGIMKDKLSRRTGLEKFLDAAPKWSRAFLLSNPVTLGKLVAAAIWRLGITPIEELVGGALSKVPLISKIAERAPREGGFSIKAEAKSFVDAVMKGGKDAYDMISKRGDTELHMLSGKKDVMPKELFDFLGELHGALKSPTKRAEFSRSLEKRTEFYIKKGVDVSDPLVQTRIITEAVKDSDRSIFMQDNRLVSRYQRFVTSLGEPDKATGTVPIGSKVLQAGMKTLLPIVRVPTNIVGEAFQYLGGSVIGSARLVNALRKGIDTLPEAQADLIMRELKKGSIGGGLLLLGYLAHQYIGGYYQKGENKPDLAHGSIKVFNHEVPSYLLHNPAMEMLQLGATIRKVSDTKAKGIPAGVMAGLLGLVEQIPFIREQTEINKLLGSDKERTQFFGELAKSRLEPALIQKIAEFFDKDKSGNKIQRSPENIQQYLESGIPGLRQNVSEKESAKKSPYTFRPTKRK